MTWTELGAEAGEATSVATRAQRAMLTTAADAWADTALALHEELREEPAKRMLIYELFVDEGRLSAELAQNHAVEIKFFSLQNGYDFVRRRPWQLPRASIRRAARRDLHGTTV